MIDRAQPGRQIDRRRAEAVAMHRLSIGGSIIGRAGLLALTLALILVAIACGGGDGGSPMY